MKTMQKPPTFVRVEWYTNTMQKNVTSIHENYAKNTYLARVVGYTWKLLRKNI